jgi:hypothetical protein
MLADAYALYDENGNRVTLDFSPHNEDWCELVNEWEGRLKVWDNVTETFYEVIQLEGDIWAIEPTDVWDEESGTYIENPDNIN